MKEEKDKELIDNIIVNMVDYIGKKDVSIDEFCSAKGIDYTWEQKNRIFEALNKQGFINTKFSNDGNGVFTITPNGILMANSLLSIRYSKEQSKKLVQDYIYHNNLQEDSKGITPNDENKNRSVDNRKEKNANEFSRIHYRPKENNNKIIDNSIEPCFGVETLAECFVKLIDRACDNTYSNVCMLGIFAPWGRGKSYFFNKIDEFIKERNKKRGIHYDVVEFNAWKYQETPAIWAYLYETLYNSKGGNFKFRYTISRNWISMSRDVLIISIPIIMTWLGNLNKWVNASIGLSVCLFIINLLLKHYNSAISFIKKYSKGISFANELGIQAEIEKEITSLLKFWIGKKRTEKKKVILYIDDIDRCSETKMTSIIDSLRTVLENEEIRKRLIIICSIDPDKIIKGIENKYKTIYNEKEIHSIAIEQMDKIFLTGIALPPLNNDQLLEFVSKLTRTENLNTINNDMQPQTSYSPNQTMESVTTSDKTEEETILFDDKEIYKELKHLINENKEQLTPRKIRIIYYRIVLANNIIYTNKNYKIKETFIKDIFDFSVGIKKGDIDNKTALSDVLNMVVPYTYKANDNTTAKENLQVAVSQSNK